jgi:hypothetical protein
MGKSMKGHQPQASKTTSWVTPRAILNALGEFDLDPCTPDEMPWDTAAKRYTVADDGLAMPWFGRVWLNPPFDKANRWNFLKRMAEHGNGIALVAASTEVKWFKQWVWGYATSILFLSERPYFHHPDGTRGTANSGCSICLVAYGHRNSRSLASSGLGFHLPIRAVLEDCPRCDGIGCNACRVVQ